MSTTTWRALGAVALALTLGSCGVNDPAEPPIFSPSPSGGTPPPSGGGSGTSTATITVTSAGVSPLEVTVAVGSKVTFVNQDSRPHDFAGGPDPNHPECPEIDVAGFVAAGQSRDTATFTTARTCRYHDHSYIGVPAFMGRIVIQ